MLSKAINAAGKLPFMPGANKAKVVPGATKSNAMASNATKFAGATKLQADSFQRSAKSNTGVKFAGCCDP